MEAEQIKQGRQVAEHAKLERLKNERSEQDRPAAEEKQLEKIN